MKKALVVTAFHAAFLLNACGGSDFESAPSRRPALPVNPEGDKPVPSSEDQTAGDVGGGRFVQTFIAEAFKPVDIAIALDTSTSMVEEKASLEQNLALFVSELTAAKIDAQVTIITKTTTASDPQVFGLSPFKLPKVTNVAAVDKYVHSNDAIGHLSRYYRGDYTRPLPLRDNALLEAVIITDDDGDTGTGPYGTTGNMAADFTPPTGRTVTVNAIVGLPTSNERNNSACALSATGDQHMNLANQTGGAIIDLCTPDWSDLVKQLSANIASRSTAFVLSKEPKTDMEFVVSVDGVVVDPKHYTLDAKTRSLHFTLDFPMKTGAQVKVEYYYAE